MSVMSKTRPKDNPYLIYKNDQGWEWRVLKANTKFPNKLYASWFCDVSSPLTYPGSDLGDTYISDIILSGMGHLVFRDPVVTDDMLPDPTQLVDPWNMGYMQDGAKDKRH